MLMVMYEAVGDFVQARCLHKIRIVGQVRVTGKPKSSIPEIKAQADFLAGAIQGIVVLHWKA
jgi:hypothetical protein